MGEERTKSWALGQFTSLNNISEKLNEEQHYSQGLVAYQHLITFVTANAKSLSPPVFARLLLKERL